MWPQCKQVLQKGVVFLGMEGTHWACSPKRVYNLPDLDMTALITELFFVS